LTGAEEGADPTLTHDLLNRSREGQWSKLLAYMAESELMEARDGGYFSSLKPAGDVPILSKALRQRKTANSTEGERTKDSKGKGKAREEVVLEKSNVLMMYVSFLLAYLYHREVVHMALLHHCRGPSSLTAEAEAVGPLGRLLSSSSRLRGSLTSLRTLVSHLSLSLISSGPTGTGKTLMAKTLAKILDVPFA